MLVSTVYVGLVLLCEGEMHKRDTSQKVIEVRHRQKKSSGGQEIYERDQLMLGSGRSLVRLIFT